jgi:heavy metal efflux system protein
MLQGLIEFCLTRRTVVVTVLLTFLGAGLFAFSNLNIEAYPNPAPPILEIIAQNPGQSAEEMERYITIPIEVAIASTPGLQYVRSTSLYGLTFVRVQFTYETEYYFALQQTLNRLSSLTLPNNVQAVISPASLTGEIFRYQLVGPPGMSPMDLRTLQDWVVVRRLKTVPGVIDVVSWGGPTKEYHVDVDLNRLPAYHVTLPQVIGAISNSNINVGGRTLDVGQQSVNVRGIGLIDSLADIENIVLTQSGGVPVLIKDVAHVEIGYTPRQGIAGRDANNDAVLAIVLMNRGERTLDVIGRLKKEVATINSSNILPAGVKLVSYYDRSDLVGVTTSTVLENVLLGILLIFMVQWVFMGGLRTALVVTATIPFALLFSTIILVLRGDSANLLSVGAVDIGIIVDATVILVENVYRNLEAGSHRGVPGAQGAQFAAAVPTVPGLSEKLRRILRGSLEVDRPILFATLITIAAFIPLFTMRGIEGQIFGPMAKTYGYALAGALIATFTISPVLSAYLMPARTKETETLLVQAIRHIYEPAIRWSMAHRKTVVSAAAVLVMIVAIVISRLGTEFLPTLEEGNLWIRATLPPTVSLEAGRPVVAQIRDIIRKYPEVVTVVSQHGRPDNGTDPAPVFNAEFFAPLKPQSQWPRGMTKEKLIQDMQADLRAQIIGVSFNFSQYIQDNIQEAVSGVKGANSIKLFGTDLKTLEAKGAEIKDQLGKVRGIEDLGLFTVLGQPNLVIDVDRATGGRYGLAPGDVNSVVQTAIGGQAVTQVFEGERQFPLVVRLAPQYRDTLEAIRNIQVANPNPSPTGEIAYVPLNELATISLQSGASYIYREGNARYIPLKFSVRGRDLGSTVAEAQELIENTVKLPEGYHIEWSGEFGALKDAQARLALIVPLSLLLILVILYSLFNNLRDTLLALGGIPFAVCGGVFALILSGQNFSISAAVGFVSLFGVTVMEGILMATYHNNLMRDGMDVIPAAIRAAELRMRPALMTSLSACIGLLPAALSTGIGSQVQRPLATVVVGGMLLVPILTLLVVPVLRTLVIPSPRKRSAPAPETEDPA